jgi:hypothetical protein
MEITKGQEHAILMALDYYNRKDYDREKSYIVCEAGNNIQKDGDYYFIGEFIVHIYRKGKFRLKCYFENHGGKEAYTIEHTKIKKLA